ncbi:MAG TPA: DUF5683 domain-containing protein [Bacteroidales bacterium]|jgi:hypothetical protein|nr:DUF5683 domain-containing protein [Bacteroidales bacterium]MDD4086171.1 DUF5683 domain-containing protein [Bacteroidales bacterium]HPE43133.1 DUF5683 domain-containing protein [Bacteroidales bacterium]
MNRSVFLTFFVLFFLALNLYAQEPESKTEVKKPHSPHKATIYSAILPGLGQAYNRKYWKIPVVYAGIGTIYYFASTNGKMYRKAREAYNYVSSESDYPIDNDFVDKYSAEDLQSIRDYYRRNMELSWVVMGLWYVVNIIDATVDAHFFDYDISEDLSLRVEPIITHDQLYGEIPHSYAGMQAGLSLKIKF